jgi:predicted PurR-regulated permease PerM
VDRNSDIRQRWDLFLPLSSAVFLALAVLFCIHTFARAICVLVLSITIADALAPIVRRLNQHLSRTLAVALVYIAVISALGLIAFFVAPALASEIISFVDRAPDILNGVQKKIGNSIPGFSLPAGITGADLARNALQYGVTIPVKVGAGLITSALVFFLSFYWLLAAPSIDSFIRSLFPARSQPEVRRLMSEMSRAMGGYLRGVAINAIVIAALIWVGLHFAGIDYAFPLAIIAGIGEFIPYLGPVLSSLPALAVASLQSPGKALAVAIIYLAVMQIEGHVLTPNIMKSQTNVPQVVVIIALFAGGAVGGVMGALVAVPLAGAIIVLTSRVIAPGIRSWTEARFG